MRISCAMRAPWSCFMMSAAIALFPTSAWASDDSQLWLTEFATVRVSDKWRFSQEIVTRISDQRHGLYEVESNSLIGYSLAPNLILWAGYTHDPNYDAGRFAIMEHRAREQVTLDDIRLGRLSMALRLRGEQRWREGMVGTGWRVRPFVRIALPLATQGQTGIAISHESFIDLNRTKFQAIEGEERMRNAVTLYTPIVTGLNVELGYMNQHRFIQGGSDGQDHAVTIALNAAFH